MGNVASVVLSALWKGTSSALAIAVPTVGIYMPCYDICLIKLRAAMSGTPELQGFVGVAPLVAGAASRMLAVLCVAPLELAGPVIFCSPRHGMLEKRVRNALDDMVCNICQALGGGEDADVGV